MSKASMRYSSALIQLAIEENKIDKTYENFVNFMEVYKKSTDLKKLLNLDLINKKEKRYIIENIFDDEKINILKNFLMLLIDKNRINEITLIFENFRNLYYKEKNILFATIYSANKLSNHDKKKLTNKLTKKYNKEIIIKEKIDNTILGGLVLHIDGKVIDLSIKSKLNDIRNELKQIKLS